MPLFAYECADCQIHAEVLVSGQSDPVCPQCGSQSLSKLPSAFAPMNGGSEPEFAPASCGAESCCMGQSGCALN